MYSGGIADKIGNRFEARWLTSQLLGLLSGEALSVTIERIGDDEQGFEFLVEQADASVWHQCKRQTSATSWTITALANEGVIENFAGKLGITSADRCVFVSTDVAKQIKLLEEKRRIATSLEEFEGALAQNEAPYWQSLMDHLAVDGEGALDWLAHCEFHAVSEDMLEEIVAHRVAFWFDGDPDAIVSAIRAWVEEDATLNRPIDRGAFLELIASRNFAVKQYELDGALPGRLKERTRSYVDSYSPLGAGLFRIDRRESDLLVEALLGTPDVDVVALVGPAGSGKSALVRDAVARIADEGVLQLAFRVDQVGEPLSIAQLGTAVIDVDDSPAVVLEKLSGNNRAILYIDQADAVSEMAGRSTQVRRQLLDLVRQARSYEHIRLVFSCRTFDFENDAQFLDIAASNRTVRIDVPMYDWERDVVPVLSHLGILIEDGPRIRSLLAQPIALSLAAKLAQNGGTDLRDVDTLSDLFERLIEDRDRAIRRRHSPAWSLHQVLEAVAAEMSERQELVASVRTLDGFAGAKDHLQQEGLIVVAGGRISLIHESLFDHLHARSFVSGSRSLVDFLTASEQTLFRRTQVRQILSAERDLRPDRYRSDLRGLLMSDAVRGHIKDFVLRWLGTMSNPTAEEWRILVDYSAGRGDDDLPKSVGIVLFGRPDWFDLLSELGPVGVWLAGEDAAQAWALNISRSVASTGSDRLVAELNRYLDDRPEQAGRLLQHLWYVGPKGPRPDLADVIVRALGLIDDVKDLDHGEGLFELNASWIEHAPEDAARILSACLDCWYRIEPVGAPFRAAFEEGSNSSHHLIELAKARPIAMLDAVLPAMAVAMRRMPGEGGPPRQDQVWHWRRRDSDDAPVGFLDIVKDAFGRAARHEPAEAERLFDIIDPADEITSLHLLLETTARDGRALAPLLARYKDHQALFEAGFEGAPASSAGEALAASWDWLGPADRKGFEDRILALWPEFDDVRWALSSRGPGRDAGRRGTERQMREEALHYLSLSGRRQWSVLRGIGVTRLSPEARDRLAFLERKFVGRRPELPSGTHIGTAGSPIPIERATLMSDDAWISAIARVVEGERTWVGNGYRGGARELARVLQARVKEQPERFLELVGRIPAGSDPSFVNGIVMGLSETNPSPAQTERFFELVEASEGPPPEDRGLVWLIRATKGEKGDRALGFMLRAAASPGDDTAVGESSRSNDEKPEPVFKQALALANHLDSRAMNSTRGSALMEIGAQSWASREKYDRFRPLIEPVVGSDMPDFLHASLGSMLVAALKFDRETAKDWITRTAERAPTSLFTRNGRRALLSLDMNEHETCRPILVRLADSVEPLEQAVGCLLIAQRSLDDERWVARIDELVERGPLQRAAIAEVAASYVADASHFSRASTWLIRFFDDDDEGVRKTAVDCFRRMAPDRMASHVSLYEAYVASRRFNGERSSFLHRLDRAPAAMDDVVLGLIEKTVAVAKSRPTQPNHGMYQIWDPLLRIYASSVHDGDRLSKCLDVLDDMVAIDGMGSGKLNAAL